MCQNVRKVLDSEQVHRTYEGPAAGDPRRCPAVGTPRVDPRIDVQQVGARIDVQQVDARRVQQYTEVQHGP